MSKAIVEVPLSTPTARRKLDDGLFWKPIDSDIHLGYRRRNPGGVWLVRWRHGAGYRRAEIGTADDVVSIGTLSFEEARRAARDHVIALRTQAALEIKNASGQPITVGSAVEDYLTARDARESKRKGRAVKSDARQRLSRYVIGQGSIGKRKPIPPAPIAAIELQNVSDDDLRAWRDGLPASLKKSTRQRLVNDFRAALNAAHDRNRGKLTSLPAIVKHGLKLNGDDYSSPIARENQILCDADVSRLIQAARIVDDEQGWEGDLYRLILVLAATGARLSQLIRMAVMDVQFAGGRLIVPASHKGKGRKLGHINVPIGQDVLDALMPVCVGRHPTAPLFERWRKVQMPGDIRWVRGERGPWKSPAEIHRPWVDIRKHSGLYDVIPYSLRHTSIVRCIRANLSLRHVAALHDTSTAMIEQHYSRYIATGLEDLARAAIVPLAAPPRGATVVPIRAAGNTSKIQG